MEPVSRGLASAKQALGPKGSHRKVPHSPNTSALNYAPGGMGVQRQLDAQTDAELELQVSHVNRL